MYIAVRHPRSLLLYSLQEQCKLRCIKPALAAAHTLSVSTSSSAYAPGKEVTVGMQGCRKGPHLKPCEAPCVLLPLCSLCMRHSQKLSSGPRSQRFSMLLLTWQCKANSAMLGRSSHPGKGDDGAAALRLGLRPPALPVALNLHRAAQRPAQSTAEKLPSAAITPT